jgi:hypothetical protein
MQLEGTISLENLGTLFILTLLCAELFLLLVKSREIQVIFKKAGQRTRGEKQQVERGLTRCFVLEAVLFVPASVALVFLIVRPHLVRSCHSSR